MTVQLRSTGNLFAKLCEKCPRAAWCPKSLERMCALPSEISERDRYWQIQIELQERIGGIAPRGLPTVTAQIELPPIIHVHVDEGPTPVCSDHYHLGVYGKNVLQRSHCFHLNMEYLRLRGLASCKKVLILAGKDRFLTELCHRIDDSFFDTLKRPDVTAIICPFLSDYRHAEHRTGLDNRAIAQNFLEALLRRGLPGVFFTYLAESDEYVEWLKAYFTLNPTQCVIATGFDRGAANNELFVRRRLDILKSVEEAIDRPLQVVLSGIMSRLPLVAAASEMFPGRVRLLAQSVYLRSVKGSSLEWLPSGQLRWRKHDRRFVPGWALFERNAATLRDAIEMQIPKFGRIQKMDENAACDRVA